jgi:hypothetical protein
VIDPGSRWNTSNTRIWFRTALAVPAGQTDDRYVLGYGPDASQVLADPGNVFLFFDDFEAGLSRWQIGAGSWTTATDAAHAGAAALKMTGPLAGANRWLAVAGVSATDVALEAYWRVTSSAGTDIGQGVRSPGASALSHYLVNLENTNGIVLAKDVGTFNTLSSYAPTPSPNMWTRYAIAIAGSRCRVFIDGAQRLPATGAIDVGTELSTGTIDLYAYAVANGQAWWVDDLFVRRYVDPEPTAIVMFP